jgi:hypothetical protein
MGLCHSCQRMNAVVRIPAEAGGTLELCADCNLKINQARAIQLNGLISVQNTLAEDMDRIAGFSVTSRIPFVPVPSMPVTGGTLNLHNITIHGNNYGIANTGSIKAVDIAVGDLDRAGERELAAALAALTKAIAETAELEDSQRGELLEQLSIISEEAAKPPETRRARAALSVAADVGTVLAGVAGLAALWAQHSTVIINYFSK